jgi:flagellar biosynthesis protein FliQ
MNYIVPVILLGLVAVGLVIAIIQSLRSITKEIKGKRYS